MACMEHACTNPDCPGDVWVNPKTGEEHRVSVQIFNNEGMMYCPKCGKVMASFFDEEPY